jgi:RecA/RadA recombinase
MLNREILEKLKNPQTLQETETSLGWISTGSLALNRIISGNYDQGIPVGAITQLRGDSSTGKTLFLTSILIEAQKKGYFTKLVDAENAYN